MEDTDQHQSEFRSARKRRAVLTDTFEIQGKLKEEGVQMTFYPCFTELYSRMFHIAKRTTTETTWESLLCQKVTATTNVEHINITVVTDLWFLVHVS